MISYCLKGFKVRNLCLSLLVKVETLKTSPMVMVGVGIFVKLSFFFKSYFILSSRQI